MEIKVGDIRTFYFSSKKTVHGDKVSATQTPTYGHAVECEVLGFAWDGNIQLLVSKSPRLGGYYKFV